MFKERSLEMTIRNGNENFFTFVYINNFNLNNLYIYSENMVCQN